MSVEGGRVRVEFLAGESERRHEVGDVHPAHEVVLAVEDHVEGSADDRGGDELERLLDLPTVGRIKSMA